VLGLASSGRAGGSRIVLGLASSGRVRAVLGSCWGWPFPAVSEPSSDRAGTGSLMMPELFFDSAGAGLSGRAGAGLSGGPELVWRCRSWSGGPELVWRCRNWSGGAGTGAGQAQRASGSQGAPRDCPQQPPTDRRRREAGGSGRSRGRQQSSRCPALQRHQAPWRQMRQPTGGLRPRSGERPRPYEGLESGLGHATGGWTGWATDDEVPRVARGREVGGLG
jgi:hypothetical protein